MWYLCKKRCWNWHISLKIPHAKGKHMNWMKYVEDDQQKMSMLLILTSHLVNFLHQFPIILGIFRSSNSADYKKSKQSRTFYQCHRIFKFWWRIQWHMIMQVPFGLDVALFCYRSESSTLNKVQEKNSAKKIRIWSHSWQLMIIDNILPLNAWRWGKHSIFGQAAEIANSKHRAIMFPCGLLQFHTKPKA